jgi:hypothetical protein
LETELEKLGKVNKGKDLKLFRVLQESGAFKTSKDEEISELNTKLAEMTAHMDDINEAFQYNINNFYQAKIWQMHSIFFPLHFGQRGA